MEFLNRDLCKKLSNKFNAEKAGNSIDTDYFHIRHTDKAMKKGKPEWAIQWIGNLGGDTKMNLRERYPAYTPSEILMSGGVIDKLTQGEDEEDRDSFVYNNLNTFNGQWRLLGWEAAEKYIDSLIK